MAAEYPGAALQRIVHRALDRHRRVLVDECTDVGLGIERITTFQRLRLFDELPGEGVGDRFEREDPLDAAAGLARVAVGTGDRDLDRLVEIRVLAQDKRVVPAGLDGDLLDPGDLRQPPPDLGAAGERDHVHLLVGHERRADLGRAAGHDGDHLRRHAAFEQDLEQAE